MNKHVRPYGKRFQERLKQAGYREAYEIEYAKALLLQKLLERRESLDLNQADLAGKMGVTQQFISEFERGRRQGFSLDTLAKFAEALGCQVTLHLVKRKENQPILKVA
ncbi:MAG: helix-turn-helix transcriptional regulator [Candidatus Omnitrophica bacterium]|nr:helix-turn-helix transcriptional regulator [Candidatus Omnitrophota bacterium]